MADVYWIKIPESDKKDLYYYSSPLDCAKEYGLSSQANSYSYDYRSVLDNTFLNVLIQYNWKVALNWLIRLTNHVADSIKQSHPEYVYDISVWIDSPEEQISFICNPDFWLVGIQEQRINELIGDGIYLFTRWAIKEINVINNDKQIVRKFAEYIKSEIIKKANNVMMLSVIAEIGRNCEKVIPGYSLFLASSIDLVMLDSQKIRILLPNEDIQLYESLALMAVGIPKLDKRYDIVAKEDSSLQAIVMKLQLLGEEFRVKAEKILDYLYSIVPNQGEDARIHLQIQKMDVRNATMSQIDERTFAITPEITGDAKKIVEENAQSKYNRDKNSFQKIIDNCNSLMAAGTFEIQDCFDTIDQLQRLIISVDAPGQLQKVLVMMIAYALSKEELTVEKRSKLCNIWLDGIDCIFNNDTFAFDFVLLKILYKQSEKDLSIETREKMMRQMLECLLYRGHQGIISKISMQIKEYLMQNANLAKSFFNTIVALAEDRMAEYRYNASKLCEIGKDVNYQPNRSTPTTWVKDIFSEHRIDLYQSKKESIIESYLFQENAKDFTKWLIDNTDIQTLCYISGCGLGFDDKDFSMVMKTMFANMMSVISTAEKYHDFLDVYSISEVKTFINNSLVHNQNVPAVLDMLFESPDFTEINSDTYELYEDIASHLLTVYFDGHNSPEVRRQCEVILNGIEDKLLNITDIKSRNKLYSMMFLTLGKFHMHDWNEIYTSYEYRDKVFLNTLWGKYGWLHFGNLVRVIDQMHITELLPEVLVALDESLNKYKQDASACERTIKENEIVINKIITKAFLDFNDKIKTDSEFTHAFESFLESLIEFNMEEAAVILDEFRIH